AARRAHARTRPLLPGGRAARRGTHLARAPALTALAFWRADLRGEEANGTVSVDVRTRVDGPAEPIDAARFFSETLPDALAKQRDAIAPGAARLGLRPLAGEAAG